MRRWVYDADEKEFQKNRSQQRLIDLRVREPILDLFFKKFLAFEEIPLEPIIILFLHKEEICTEEYLSNIMFKEISSKGRNFFQMKVT